MLLAKQTNINIIAIIEKRSTKIQSASEILILDDEQAIFFFMCFFFIQFYAF